MELVFTERIAFSLGIVSRSRWTGPLHRRRRHGVVSLKCPCLNRYSRGGSLVVKGKKRESIAEPILKREEPEEDEDEEGEAYGDDEVEAEEYTEDFGDGN